MTVAIALAEKPPPQSPTGGGSHVRRAQKTVRATGARPGVLEEPEPQGAAATVGYVAAPVTLFVPPVLGGGDTLDDATVSFLLAQSLLERPGVGGDGGRGEEEGGEEVEEQRGSRGMRLTTVPPLRLPLARGGRGRRGRSANFPSPLLQVVDVPVIINDKFQQLNFQL